MNETRNEIRLTHFQVKGLFGEIDHNIPINHIDRVTAILAPNGMGKTICLRMIEALFRRHWGFFQTVEFKSVTYQFSNEAEICIAQSESETASDREKRSDNKFTTSVKINYPSVLNFVPIEWKPQPSSDFGGSRVESFLPFLTRIAAGRWIHDLTGETYTISEVIQNFGSQLPDIIVKSAHQDEPEELKSIIESIDCHLIETQRLLVLNDTESERYRGPQRKPQSSLAISKKAKSLSDIIAQNLQQYATLSQSLDSTFPQRVIQSKNASSTNTVRDDIELLEKKRDLLTQAGILDKDSGGSFELLPKEIDASTLRVLSVYTNDTKEKLGSLQQLLDRIQLFKTLVGSRFTNKSITVDRKAGIKVASRKGDVPLEKLSSGEQHQLVLFFELLFELKENALILIDEPELSLHVAWQAKFISDLMAIIALNKFDVVLATHSPQLIGGYDDLIVELGDVT